MKKISYLGLNKFLDMIYIIGQISKINPMIPVSANISMYILCAAIAVSIFDDTSKGYPIYKST